MLLDEKQASTTKKETVAVKKRSMCELIANSCMHLFTNRKKCQDLHACFVNQLKILETRINAVILKGKVGQEASEDEWRAMKLAPKLQTATVQQSPASPLAGNPTKADLGSRHMANTGPARHQSVKRPMRLKPETQMVTRQTSERTKKRKRGGASSKEKSEDTKANA